MKFVQSLLLIATFNLLFPNTQTAAVSERSGKTYLCGDYLGKMLSDLCHGRYNGPRESRIEIESGKAVKLPFNISIIYALCYRKSSRRRTTGL